MCTASDILNIIPSDTAIQSSVSITDLGSPDVFLKIQSIPEQVRSGRDLLLSFEVRNKNDVEIDDLTIDGFDNCFLKSDSGSEEPSFDLKPNATKTFMWTWKAKEVDMDRECTIRFMNTYTAKNVFYQDIIVLSESEYIQRELDGTTGQINIQSSQQKTSVQMSLSFSDSQPFMDDAEYYMYLDIIDTGVGMAEIKELKLIFPDNVKKDSISCNGFTKDEYEMTLTKKLYFTNKRK